MPSDQRLFKPNFHFPIKQENKCLCDKIVCCKDFRSCPSLFVSWMIIQYSNGELNLKHFFATVAIETRQTICKIRLFYIFFWYFDRNLLLHLYPHKLVRISTVYACPCIWSFIFNMACCYTFIFSLVGLLFCW